MWWVSVFHYKIVDGESITLHWHTVLDFKGFIFNVTGFDYSVKIQKVESF